MMELAKLATSFEMKADSGDSRGLSHTWGDSVCSVCMCAAVSGSH